MKVKLQVSVKFFYSNYIIHADYLHNYKIINIFVSTKSNIY